MWTHPHNPGYPESEKNWSNAIRKKYKNTKIFVHTAEIQLLNGRMKLQRRRLCHNTCHCHIRVDCFCKDVRSEHPNCMTFETNYNYYVPTNRSCDAVHHELLSIFPPKTLNLQTLFGYCWIAFLIILFPLRNSKDQGELNCLVSGCVFLPTFLNTSCPSNTYGSAKVD